MKTLAKPLLAAMMLMMSACGGCEDFRLVKMCSRASVDKAQCVGSPEDFIIANPNHSDKGSCSIGRIHCRQELFTIEEHCGDDQACRDGWDSIRTDDLCIGHQGPKTEVCDGIDNNCDGQVDEVFDYDGDGYKSADTLDVDGNACGTDCDDFDPLVHPNMQEVCDGADQNCNGEIDEGLDSVGVCHPDIPEDVVLEDLVLDGSTQCVYQVGKLSCIDGEIECIGANFIGPEPEQCDGIDNNCNGFADEPGAVVGEGDACGSDIGVCEPGYLICNPVISDMICVDAVTGSSPDGCDNLDNDCDGQTDEDAEPVLCNNGCPQWGYQYCVVGEYSVCDAPLPVSEDDDPCNGLDDDCDGMIDEGQQCGCDPSEIGPMAPDCTIAEMQQAQLQCGTAKKDCICENGNCDYGECYQACDPWVNGVPVDDPNTWWAPCPPEQCDAWDHNCFGSPPNENIDGLVDVPCACDPNSPVPAIAAAAQNGNCEEGICTAGQQTCEFNNQTNQWEMSPDDCDAVGPEEEVCDDLDNDCDGDVDEDLNSFDRVDMVFAIDITGSMSNEIQAVHAAISAYAQDFQQTEHRFALLLYPAPAGMGWGQVGSPANSCNDVAYWNMTGGLVEVGPFLAALQQVLNTGLVCGSEPSYDVLDALTTVQDPAQIGWRNDAYPYVFLLGDEMAQTWSGLTEAAIEPQAQTCNGIGGCPCMPPDCPAPVNNFEIHCFVTTPTYTTQFDNICYNDVVGDSVYDINSISAEILRGIFADVCLP